MKCNCRSAPTPDARRRRGGAAHRRRRHLRLRHARLSRPRPAPQARPGARATSSPARCIEQSAAPAGPVGRRVTGNPLITCGRCDYCVQGRDNLCANRTMVGMTRPGAFAECMSIPGRCLIDDARRPGAAGRGADRAGGDRAARDQPVDARAGAAAARMPRAGDRRRRHRHAGGAAAAPLRRRPAGGGRDEPAAPRVAGDARALRRRSTRASAAAAENRLRLRDRRRRQRGHAQAGAGRRAARAA